MVPVDFIYENEYLSSFDLVTLESKEQQSFISREIEKSEITSVRPSPLHYGVKYSDVLKLNFFIGRYLNNDIVKLKEEDINDIRSWLESPKYPQKLVVLTTSSNEDTIIFYGLFTEIQPYVVSGEYYGLYLTFTCNSPYGYSEDVNEVYKFPDNYSVFDGTFYNLSAEKFEYLMPKITIESKSVFGQNEILYIVNHNDNDRVMTITLPEGKSKIIIDCDEKIIMDENGILLTLSDIGVTTNVSASQFINSISFYWLSLVYGVNNLNFTATVNHTIKSITLSTKFAIKLGGF